MLLVSFNVQEQDPDDILAQDRQWAPCLLVECLHHCNLVLTRLSTKEDNSHFPLHLVSQWCLKTVHRNSLITDFYRPTWALYRLSFRSTVYSFHLLVGVWFVFIVMSLDVLELLRLLFSRIFVTPPYLFLCIFPSPFLFGDLPKRHMWGVFLISSIGFYRLHIVLV